MPKRTRRNKQSSQVSVKVLPKGGIAKLLASQRAKAQAARTARAKVQAAREALRKFRPRSADRGHIILINGAGKRIPIGKGKKGYAVYISTNYNARKRSGRKYILREKGEQIAQRKATEIKIPMRRNFKKAAHEFIAQQTLVIGKERRKVSRALGEIAGERTFFNALTRDIVRVMDGQQSKRKFVIEILALGEGRKQPWQVMVTIGRSDFQKISASDIKQFVRKKVWAHLARELMYDGYVSQGSDNFIRRLEVNQGENRDDWQDSKDQLWSGHDLDTINLKKISWRIYQAK